MATATIEFRETDLNETDIGPVKGITVKQYNEAHDTLIDTQITDDDGLVSFTVTNGVTYYIDMYSVAEGVAQYPLMSFYLKRNSLGQVTPSLIKLYPTTKVETLSLTITDMSSTALDADVTITTQDGEQQSGSTNESGIVSFSAAMNYNSDSPIIIQITVDGQIITLNYKVTNNPKNLTVKLGFNLYSEESLLAIEQLVSNEVVGP